MQNTNLIQLATGHDIELVGHPDGWVSGLKQRALFVALVLNANDALPRDHLATLLWPDTSQDAARQNLRMTLLKLRHALPDEWSARIEATPQTICLNVERDKIDVFAIEDAAEAATPDDFRRIEALYNGDLLAQFPEVSPEFDHSLDMRRTSLRHVFHSAMLRLLEEARDSGDQLSFQRHHDRLHQVVPESEQAIELAMAFWAGLGATDRLDDAFGRFRQSYSDAFDAPPPDHLEAAFTLFRERSIETSRLPPVESPAASPRMVLPDGEALRVRTGQSLKSWRGIALAVLLLAVAAMVWTRRPEGRTVELAVAEADLDGCMIESVVARYRDMIVQALLDGGPKIQIVGDDAAPGSTLPDLDVRQSIRCTGNSFRGTTVIVENATQTIVWSGQHEVLDVEIDLAGVLD